MKELSPDTVVRFAIHPADAGRIAYIDGLWNGHTLPRENEVITRPFLVDPTTREPVPVRVVQIVEMLDATPPTIAVVVSREQ